MAPVAKRKKPPTEAKPETAKKPRTQAKKVVTNDAVTAAPAAKRPGPAARKRKSTTQNGTDQHDESGKDSGVGSVGTAESSATVAPANGQEDGDSNMAASTQSSKKRRREMGVGQVAEKTVNGESKTATEATNKKRRVAAAQKLTPKSEPSDIAPSPTAPPARINLPSEAASLPDEVLDAVDDPSAHTKTAAELFSSARPDTESPAMEGGTRKKERVKTKFEERRAKLHKTCVAAKPIGEIFTIQELTEFGIADDEEELLELCKDLTRRFLFVVLRLNRGLMYKARTYDKAKMLSKLGADQLLVYTVIESCGRTGIWRRPLELRTNLHPSTVAKSVKELKALKVINDFGSADTNRKTFICSDITPDQKHLGGAFIEDGKIDEGVVSAVSGAIYAQLQIQGWFEVPRSPTESKLHDGKTRESKNHDRSAVAKTIKSKADPKMSSQPDPKAPAPEAPSVVDDTSASRPVPKERRLYERFRSVRNLELVPRPASFTAYPTILDLTVDMNERQIVRDRQLSIEDISQFVARMEYDGLIERMRGPDGEQMEAFRAAKVNWRLDWKDETRQRFGPIEPDERGWLPGNGLSQVPCTRCPVRKSCKTGGTINPEECPYLGEYLDF